MLFACLPVSAVAEGFVWRFLGSLCSHEATKDLRERVGNLKNMYGSGIKALDDLAEEPKLFKGIALEADSLLNDLQSSLHKQVANLTTYAHQQQEAHARATFEVTKTLRLTQDNSLLSSEQILQVPDE
ncbi:hypothetical protein VIGAN_06065400 [Vigna angularis var. angularis]|uniref:Uncharacterized protein n=1 Tax=Vigna angularis var. angularis TaxID=157739 RepID=A0A0S3SA16_PHAAN|nr:hypothetical protein VIGAN_06065400 [Vigna angularis var. angularis]